MAESMTPEQRIQLILETFGSDKVIKDFKKVELGVMSLAKLNKSLGIKQKEGIENFRGSLLDAAKIDQASLATSRFRMEWLGLMFAGMAIQRTFGGMFKDLIANYRKLGHKTNPLNIALTRLEANFTFLKYSIMEAASGPLTLFITWLADFANTLANMDPEKLQLIAYGVAGFAVVGAFAFAFGQFGMAFQSFAKTLKALTGKDITKLENLGKALQIFGAATAITIGIKILWDMLTDPSDAKSRLMSILGITAAGAVAGGLIGGMIGGPIGMAIGGGLGATIGLTIGIIAGIADAFHEDSATSDDLFAAVKKNLAFLLGSLAVAAMFGAATGGWAFVVILPAALKIAYDMFSSIDANQAAVKQSMREEIKIAKEEFDRQWALQFQTENPMMKEEFFKDFGRNFQITDGNYVTNLSALFGGDYSELENYFLTYEQNALEAQKILDANFATEKANTAELLADKKNVWTESTATAFTEVANFLKNDSDGGQALLNLAADLDTKFTQAFRDRTMTVTIKYKEEDKPEGVGGFDDVNSGSTY